MRTFPNFPPQAKKPCPICGTKKGEPCTLITISGTSEGFTAEAEVFHIKCLELTYFPDMKMVAQKWV